MLLAQEPFTFARLQYPQLLSEESVKGYYTDYPTADDHLVAMFNRITRVKAVAKLVPLDKGIFHYPLLYIVEPEQLNLSTSQVLLLREYIERGGMIWLDDFHGDDELSTVLNTMGRILPRESIYEPPLDHEMFHVFFDIPRVEQVLNDSIAFCAARGECDPWENGPSGKQPHIYLMHGTSVIMVYNSDTGDGIEFANDPAYPQWMAAYAMRLATNIVIYSLSH